MEGELAGMRLAERGEHFHTAVTSHSRKLAHQTALADAGWPHYPDHCAVAIDCAVQQPLDGGQLPPSTHQIGFSTPDTAVPFLYAQQPLGGHRCVGTPYLNQLRSTEVRCAINESCGGRAEHHPTRR